MRKLNTEDIFALARALKEANAIEILRKELSDLTAGKKAVKTEDVEKRLMADPVGIAFAIISAFAKKEAEKELFDFLSGPFEMTADEIKKLPPEQTLAMIKGLASSEDFGSFFKSAAELQNRMSN